MAPNDNPDPQQDEHIIWDHSFSGTNIFAIADNQTGKVNVFVKEDVRDLLKGAEFEPVKRGGVTYFVVSWKSNGVGGISAAGPDTQC